MTEVATEAGLSARPKIGALVQLLKPITWFPPMWAFGCGVVSAGGGLVDNWALVIGGVLLAGPLVCGASQGVNDWFDRHVDAINEPNRPIPSGRVPGRWGLGFAIFWSILSLLCAWALGPLVFAAACVGMVLAWAYSAPPRLKLNGWWGNSAVAACYEGLPWFTGAVVITNALPDWRILALLALYSVGAHGIMTLNDFKSIDGDRRSGIRTLPVQLGADRAARLACIVMALPQIGVILLLLSWQQVLPALAIVGLLGLQIAAMTRMLRRPRALAPWYNATGVTAYVAGMMVAAFAVRSLLQSLEGGGL